MGKLKLREKEREGEGLGNETRGERKGRRKDRGTWMNYPETVRKRLKQGGN